MQRQRHTSLHIAMLPTRIERRLAGISAASIWPLLWLAVFYLVAICAFRTSIH